MRMGAARRERGTPRRGSTAGCRCCSSARNAHGYLAMSIQPYKFSYFVCRTKTCRPRHCRVHSVAFAQSPEMHPPKREVSFSRSHGPSASHPNPADTTAGSRRVEFDRAHVLISVPDDVAEFMSNPNIAEHPKFTVRLHGDAGVIFYANPLLFVSPPAPVHSACMCFSLLFFLFVVTQQFDTDNPMLSIGPHVLRGKYVEVAGSDLVFDPMQSKNAGFVTSCSRRLVFEYTTRGQCPSISRNRT